MTMSDCQLATISLRCELCVKIPFLKLLLYFFEKREIAMWFRIFSRWRPIWDWSQVCGSGIKGIGRCWLAGISIGPRWIRKIGIRKQVGGIYTPKYQWNYNIALKGILHVVLSCRSLIWYVWITNSIITIYAHRMKHFFVVTLKKTCFLFALN